MRLPFKRVPSSVVAAAVAILGAASLPAFAGVSITQTTDPTALGSFLSGAGVTVTSTTIVNGDASQFGTYTGFSGSVVNMGNGVVLSSGKVTDAVAGGSANSSTNQNGTAEFNAYGPGNITNFNGSYDVAALKIDFTLATASAVSFSFAFGSIEYPVYTSNFTDAFLAFLDGTGSANQIVFDSNGKPVQVGASFASSLTTADTSTAFTNPHGLVGPLTTTTGVLSAGAHSILFEVGDVNDHVLDSAVFLTGFGTSTGGGTGPVTEPGGGGTPTPAVPEPSTYALMALGLGLLGATAKRRARRG